MKWKSKNVNKTKIEYMYLKENNQLGFEMLDKPNHVYKLKKALYGLKQSPRAWYERLSKFLLEKDFSRGKVDTTLFIKVYPVMTIGMLVKSLTSFWRRCRGLEPST